MESGGIGLGNRKGGEMEGCKERDRTNIVIHLWGIEGKVNSVAEDVVQLTWCM